MTPDKYGRSVDLVSDGKTDVYVVGESFKVAFPFGTKLDKVYESINSMKPEIPLDKETAVQSKTDEFKRAVQDLISFGYDTQTQFTLLLLFVAAKDDGMLERANYIHSWFDWMNAVLKYQATFIDSISQIDDPLEIMGLQWDFDQVMADPMISMAMVLSIQS